MILGKLTNVDSGTFEELKLDVDKQLGIKNEKSAYNPSEEERFVRKMILKHFGLGYVTMYKPRVEFNDLSTIYRDQVDFMAFNTYQPNNGDNAPGDEINGWRSNAIKPVVRNKCISIGAHATARLIFPKVFAFDRNSENQQDAAQVLMDLMEWSGERSNYAQTSLLATIQAEVAPASIVHTEYVEVYRKVKVDQNEDGSWNTEVRLDETLSGFQDSIVPVDQLYIENFFEPDIQKQGWLVWRRVQSYSLLEAKYGHFENWAHVRPGVQLIYNDANQGFYYVYDPELRQYFGEEIIYWNRAMDLKIIMVNGVMLTKHDNPNPRWDKLFPFAKFGYEFINSRCFYYKSLAFKVSHDANIVNTLYPMMVDGTYLAYFPPLINKGGETIASDVMVPGATTTLSDPDASLTPIKTDSNMKTIMDALFKVEESLNQTSEIPVTANDSGNQTAYEIAKRDQERNTILGMFVQMIGSYVKQFGILRIGDILQYLTVPEVDQITDNPELVYKTFLLHNKKTEGKSKTRKIKFDTSLPQEEQTKDQKLSLSYETLKMEGGRGSDQELYRVNPELIRKLKYMVVISPDVLNPLSEEVERAFMLEEYDRAIQNPILDQEKVTKDFLLSAYPKSSRDPDRYMKTAASNPMDQINQAMNKGQASPVAQGGQGNSNPLANPALVGQNRVQANPTQPALSMR